VARDARKRSFLMVEGEKRGKKGRRTLREKHRLVTQKRSFLVINHD
jgi:hypothetical protein